MAERKGRTGDRRGRAGPELSRRQFLWTSALVGAGAVVPWGSTLDGVAVAQEVPSGFAERFLAPGRAVRPKFRWWWPHGKVDLDEIVREINQIADGGFGGAEIADVHHSTTAPIDPENYGWATAPWIEAVETALQQAKVRGLSLDVTIGPSWPAAVPTITPDSVAAAKELAHGMATVAGGETFHGAIPNPRIPASDGVETQVLLAVQAARLNTANSTDEEIGLDADSVQDLTAQVVDGQLTWTALADGDWVIVSYWLRGSGQRPERGPHTEPLSFVVDHFSMAGTQAIIDFWESTVLTSTMRKLLREAGATLFEDSIELETDTTLWTSDLLAEFERRTGYPLHPYLAVVMQEDEEPVFAFDADLTRQVRRDLGEVFTELYIENHLEMLRKWAHSIGLRLRIQPYGLETDAIAKAAIVDVVEGESLGFRNLDDFRCLAGGRDMGRKRILSNEAGAYAGGAYNTTWERILRTLGGQYAAGVNQTVLHGFSYADAPGVKWPGFAAFTPYDGRVGFAESWGPRQPTWRHVTDISGYLSRTQQVLQTGIQKADVAVLRQRGYAGTGLGAPWFTADGIPVGWTHQFLSPRLLRMPSAEVTGGRLAPDGPAYKVLVFEGDIFARRRFTLQVDTAERLVEFARAGLPIVFVGPPEEYRVPGVPKPGENARLQALLGELAAQASVRNVADRPGIPGALADLGIRLDMESSQRSTLLNVHRIDDGVDLCYLCNGRHAENSRVDPIDHVVSLVRSDPAECRTHLMRGRETSSASQCTRRAETESEFG